LERKNDDDGDDDGNDRRQRQAASSLVVSIVSIPSFVCFRGLRFSFLRFCQFSSIEKIIISTLEQE